MTTTDFGAGEVVTGLDWMRYTVSWGEDDGDWPGMIRRATSPRIGWEMTGEKRQGAKGYNAALPLSAGVAHVHTERREQGIGIELTGAALEELRRLGMDDKKLLEHMHRISAKPSRLDFAIDLKGVPASPFDIYELWEQGKLKTRARKVMCFSSSEKRKDDSIASAETLYFGARSSSQQLRIYDKAAQLGIDGYWVRIEASIRKRRAADVFYSMRKYSIAGIGRSTIRAIVGCEECAWWTRAMEGPCEEVQKTPRKDTNTARWLKEDVLPVLQRVVTEEAEQGIYSTWLAYAQGLKSLKEQLGLSEDRT